MYVGVPNVLMSVNELDLEALSGIGRERADNLRSNGYESIDSITRASVEDLVTVPGISRRLAKKIRKEARDRVPDRSSESTRDELSRDGAAVAAAGRFAHVSSENHHLLDLSLRRERLWRIDPGSLTPVLFPPCRVDVLIVADDFLHFNGSDFGLEAFVDTLLQTPGGYVDFHVTLAHRGSGLFSAALTSHPRVEQTITNFDFDDPNHFDTDMYDQVWLFGADDTGGLSEAELRAISEFMDNGGGMFATGDHGALGYALCSQIPRVRSMRHWDESSGEVAMGDERRNDTNRIGANLITEFDDQSDDIPQPVEPKMYRVWSGIWEVSYPHPILCGPNGAIRVMPDHPHEGECIEPSDTTQSDTFDGYTIIEYPAGSGGAPQPLPEVISTSNVPAGNTADTKLATDPQNFGGISAYDGHSADVGRVVTDATWHHFVNINLVGDLGNPDPVKSVGFLASAAGQDHLEEIKTYFRNIAIWISPASLISCMSRCWIWKLLWNHRVIEAVSTRSDVNFELADARYIFDVGRHARDVLGKNASQCQSLKLVIDILDPILSDEVIELINPWRLSPRRPDPIPWTNLEPTLDLALGGALIALREEFPEADPDVRDQAEEVFEEVVNRGAKRALEMGAESMEQSVEQFADLTESFDSDIPR